MWGAELRVKSVVNGKNHSTEMCSGSVAGSYLRLIDSCVTQPKAQSTSKTWNESKDEAEEGRHFLAVILRWDLSAFRLRDFEKT